MSEISVPTQGDGWDLLEVLAERSQPTAEVAVYLDEASSFVKSELLKAKAKLKDSDAAGKTKLDKAIADVDKLLAKRKFTVHLRAVPTRMREDIASKALAEHPIKRSSIFDDDNAKARKVLEDNMIWHAMITGIDNPDGVSRTQFSLEQIAAISASFPDPAARAVDAKIVELLTASEKFTVDSQDVDFS